MAAAEVAVAIAKKKRPLTRKEHALLILAVERLQDLIHRQSWTGLPTNELIRLQELCGGGGCGVARDDLDKLAARLREQFPHALQEPSGDF